MCLIKLIVLTMKFCLLLDKLLYLFSPSGFFNQLVIFILNANAWLSISPNYSSSLNLTSFSKSTLYSLLALISILNISLNWPVSQSIVITFLNENGRYSMVAYFLVNIPLILLLVLHNYTSMSHLYATPFIVRFNYLLLLPSPKSAFTTFLFALQFTHFKQYFHQVNWVFLHDHLFQVVFIKLFSLTVFLEHHSDSDCHQL